MCRLPLFTMSKVKQNFSTMVSLIRLILRGSWSQLKLCRAGVYLAHCHVIIVSAFEFLLQTNVGPEFTILSAGEMLHVHEGLCSKSATVKIYRRLILKIENFKFDEIII